MQIIVGRRRAIALVVGAIILGAGLVAPGWSSPAWAGTDTEVRLVSHTPGSPVTAVNGPTRTATMSADGRFVAFVSAATDVVAGQVDANGGDDVFLHDRSTGATSLVTHVPGSATTTANVADQFEFPSISADGSFVTFMSRATDLVPGQNDANDSSDVFLYERATGMVTLVSSAAGSPTTTANGGSQNAIVSGDGSSIAFISGASNIVSGQVGAAGIFLHRRVDGATALVTHTPGAPTTAAASGAHFARLSISEDGGYLAFRSRSTQLVAGQIDPSNSTDDIFVYERATGIVTLASHVAGNPVQSASAHGVPRISADGAFVVFESLATDLVAGQTETQGLPDVFLFERSTGTVTLVSHIPGAPASSSDGVSGRPSISGDGSMVTFTSEARNLVAGQVAFAGEQLLLFERATGVVTLVSHVPTSGVTPGDFPVGPHAISRDGRFVTFQSTATNLVAGQTAGGGGSGNVFLSERATGKVSLVSHAATSRTTAANAASRLAESGATADPNDGITSISADGNVVLLLSQGKNLVTGQVEANFSLDAFVFRRGGDRHPPADFDGDRRTDLSVFRPSAGAWLIRNQPTVFLGLSSDTPVPCDYDGDGTTDIAVFRPSVGGWYFDGSTPVFFGLDGDVPVPGDYDADGRCDVAVFRPSVGGWYIQNQATVFTGLSGDIPVPGDYDGDGSTDVVVYRPGVGGWYGNGTATFFGLGGDVPVPGDYDADGSTDVAIFRSSVGGWYARGQTPRFLGLGGDIPQPGDYDGDGRTDVAVYRPGESSWFVAGQAAVSFGASGDLPVPLPSAIRTASP